MNAKCVMIAIRPKWVDLIRCGKKKIEVRKTRPICRPPFLCYIYETGVGVVGKFRCINLQSLTRDYSGEIYFLKDGVACYLDDPEKPWNASCVDGETLGKYLGERSSAWGWRVFAPVFYDEPIPLSRFSKWGFDKDVPLKRPPQDWCYCYKIKGGEENEH